METSFASGIGRSLVGDGVIVDLATMTITDRLRRKSITGVTDAVVGFQHGRCLICNDVLVPGEPIAVDHVFPLALMHRLGVTGWTGPDLDAIWNLAPVHATCNAAKGAALPKPDQLRRLAERNPAIMGSPHPLRRTLELTLSDGGHPAGWQGFVTAVDALVHA